MCENLSQNGPSLNGPSLNGPSFKSSLYDPKPILSKKNFNQQMTCGAPVRWSKYTTWGRGGEGRGLVILGHWQIRHRSLPVGVGGGGQKCMNLYDPLANLPIPEQEPVQ